MNKIILLISLVAATELNAQALSKTDASLRQEIQRRGKAEAIVYFEAKADLTGASLLRDRTIRIQHVFSKLNEAATQSQKSARSKLAQLKLAYRPFYIENAIFVRAVDKRTLKTLESLPQVRRIARNVKAKLKIYEPTLRAKEVPSHLEFIGVDKAWSEFKTKGKGIVIAGQDTGYYWEHRALKKQYRGYDGTSVNHNYNWHDAIAGTDTPFDTDGHGTHTMGTMVGFDGGNQEIGVAPESRWMGCRNMNNDTGSVASYLECFQFLLAPYPHGGDPVKDGRPAMAPHIVNNSWSCPPTEGCHGDELLGSLKAMRAAGIFVVAAGGNHGPGCSSLNRSPAMFSSDIVSVGAFNRYTKDIVFFSSLGPSAWDGGLAPQLVAPGEVVRSAWIGGPDKYDEKSGTSTASPQLAGVVALLWSKFPQLIGEVDRTREILFKSARPTTAGLSCPGFPGHVIPNVVHGHGMLDAHAALKTATSLF